MTVRPVEAGVDTFRVATYLGDERSLRALRQPGLTTRPARGGALLVGPQDGVCWPLPATRALFYPSTSLLAVEGHPSGEAGVLAAPDDVPSWCDELREALHLHGVRVDDRLGVARCDAAVTIETQPAEGRALLAGVAALVPARAKLETFRSAAAIETVYHVSDRVRKLARVYDSGRAYETADPLTRLRAEDQRRSDRPARRVDARTVTTANVRQAFSDRWDVLRRARGVTVATVPVVVDKLGVAVETGATSYARAEQALGYTLLSRSGVDVPERTARRRRALLRELGVVLLEGELEPVEVDVASTFDAMCDEAVWR